jgi:hypothetical protein
MTIFEQTWDVEDQRRQGRDDAIWYSRTGHDLVVVVRRGEQAVSIYADGDLVVLHEADGRELTSVLELEHIGCSDDYLFFVAQDNGEISFLCNPWFELYQDCCLGIVSDSLTVAIKQAERHLLQQQAGSAEPLKDTDE